MILVSNENLSTHFYNSKDDQMIINILCSGEHYSTILQPDEFHLNFQPDDSYSIEMSEAEPAASPDERYDEDFPPLQPAQHWCQQTQQPVQDLHCQVHPEQVESQGHGVHYPLVDEAANQEEVSYSNHDLHGLANPVLGDG